MRAVERSVLVLEFLVSQEHPCGPSEISRATKLAKPVVLRILRTWEALGYVRSQDGAYEVGWRVFTLAAARGDAQNLQTAARRYLKDLNDQSGETVHLTVLVGNQVLYLDKLEGRQAIRVYTAVGRRGPLYASASGKAMLAQLGPVALEEVISEGPIKYTERTIVSAVDLRRDIAETAKRGYSINSGEWHIEVGGVGAPVFNRQGRVEAALSITFPVAGVTAERIAHLGQLVSEASQLLSKERGWLGDR